MKQVECHGCRKLFQLSSYQIHVAECEEVVVTCENCEERFSRKALASHPIVRCLVNTVRDLKRENTRLW